MNRSEVPPHNFRRKLEVSRNFSVPLAATLPRKRGGGGVLSRRRGGLEFVSNASERISSEERGRGEITRSA